MGRLTISIDGVDYNAAKTLPRLKSSASQELVGMMNGDRPRPTVFFKYLSPDGLKAVLDQRAIRFCDPRTFNDPFDVQIEFRVDFSWEEFEIAYARELVRLSFSADKPLLDPTRVMYPFIRRIRALAEDHPGTAGELEFAARMAVRESRSTFEAGLSRANENWKTWLGTGELNYTPASWGEEDVVVTGRAPLRPGPASFSNPLTWGAGTSLRSSLWIDPTAPRWWQLAVFNDVEAVRRGRGRPARALRRLEGSARQHIITPGWNNPHTIRDGYRLGTEPVDPEAAGNGRGSSSIIYYDVFAVWIEDQFVGPAGALAHEFSHAEDIDAGRFAYSTFEQISAAETQAVQYENEFRATQFEPRRTTYSWPSGWPYAPLEFP